MTALQPFKANLKQLAIENNDYRRVIFTSNMQVVLMSLKVGDFIELEVHKENDQLFTICSGICKIVIGNKIFSIGEGESLIVPKNTYHYVTNQGNTPLKMYTIYSPWHHKPGTVHPNMPEVTNMKDVYKSISKLANLVDKLK